MVGFVNYHEVKLITNKLKCKLKGETMCFSGECSKQSTKTFFNLVALALLS